MTNEELDNKVRKYLEDKKRSSKIDRKLVYELYNAFFPKQKRDWRDCTCRDKATDLSVLKYLEGGNHKFQDQQEVIIEEPLPIESSVKIDMSSLMKPKRGRKPKSQNTEE
jgi:hypothetical protein